MKNKYKVTFSCIDVYLCYYIFEKIYEGENIGEVFSKAQKDERPGEFGSDCIEITQIKLIEEED